MGLQSNKAKERRRELRHKEKELEGRDKANLSFPERARGRQVKDEDISNAKSYVSD